MIRLITSTDDIDVKKVVLKDCVEWQYCHSFVLFIFSMGFIYFILN